VNRSLRSVLALLSLVIASHARADGPAAQADPEAIAERPPQRISGAVTERPESERLRLVPPFSRDRAGNTTTTALFPFYFDRKSPKSVERFVLPYYFYRDAKLQADVALGLVWSLRGPDRNTLVLGPLYTHRHKQDWGFGLPPLFVAGEFSGHHHLIIPALLTWIDGDDKKHRRIVGPYYDVKTERSRWRGVVPLVWSKEDDADSFTVVPPLYFRFTQNDPFETTTVVPPFYHSRTKDSSSWGLVPLVFHNETPELKATTVPLALFHHAKGPNEFRLVTPLLAYLDNKEDGKTLITPLYQRRRGDKNFDAVAPLFFRTWDDRDASSSLVLAPFYWHFEDPANRTDVVFPFFARDYHDGISDFWLVPGLGRKKSLDREHQQWWAAPTFDWGWDATSWHFNLHPLMYVKRSPEHKHTAIAPVYWDFKNKKDQTHRFALAPLYWDFKDFKEQKRSRVAFPFYWDFQNGQKKRIHTVSFPFFYDLDFQDREERYTITFPFHARGKVRDRTRHFVLNTMTEKKADADKSWQFHFFPLFSVGGSKRSKWWNVLYGLAGYDRRGGHRRMHAFWIPINLD
jgi:hypothetical protein